MKIILMKNQKRTRTYAKFTGCAESGTVATIEEALEKLYNVNKIVITISEGRTRQMFIYELATEGITKTISNYMH